jgi:hypothetical protein
MEPRGGEVPLELGHRQVAASAPRLEDRLGIGVGTRAHPHHELVLPRERPRGLGHLATQLRATGVVDGEESLGRAPLLGYVGDIDQAVGCEPVELGTELGR